MFKDYCFILTNWYNPNGTTVKDSNKSVNARLAITQLESVRNLLCNHTESNTNRFPNNIHIGMTASPSHAHISVSERSDRVELPGGTVVFVTLVTFVVNAFRSILPDIFNHYANETFVVLEI